MSRTAPIALVLALVMAACSSGPAPQPVTTESLDSGEETSRQAADFESQGRSAAETVIYSSSRGHWPDDRDHDDDQETSRVPVVATLYVDGQGRLLDHDGELVSLHILDEVFDPNLSDQVLGLIIDPHAGRLDFQVFAPLIEAVEAHHGLLRVDFGEVPEFVGEPDEPDEADGDEADGDEADQHTDVE